MADPNQQNEELDGRRLDDEDEDVDMIDDDNDDSDDEPFHLAENSGAVMGPQLLGVVRDRLFRQFIQDDVDRRLFVQTLRVFSVAHLDFNHQNLESGGKVLLPPSALDRLSRSSSALLSPMMFKTTNLVTQQYTHCGVLEFTAEEGRCYMPTWMMIMLGVVDNEEVRIERVNLPIATFAKFQPQSVDFLDVTNPKAMLENCLRTYACLTKGDVLAIHYNNHVYQLLVLELSPRNAVSIIECDMNVDFAPPLGYVSPSQSRETEETVEDNTEASSNSTFIPFTGIGNRINGKAVRIESVSNNTNARATRGQPDHEWRFGTLQFTRTFRRAQDSKNKSSESQGFRPFEGAGQSIWNRKGDE